MPVEAGKEAKSVLTGQSMLDRCHARIGTFMAAGTGAIVGDRDAARLAAGKLPALEDHHVEAALDQLVRGAHARYAAA